MPPESNPPTSSVRSLEFLKIPIVLAPMASGATTPELVAAVSNAGGLGCLGCAMHAPSAIERDVAKIRTLTSRPFAINLFVLEELPPPDPAVIGVAWNLLKPIRIKLGLSPDASPPTKFGESFSAQFEALVASRPPMASFTFGILTKDQMHRLHDFGCFVIGTATSVAEARAWEAIGANAICAQGSDAGGHRGTFLHHWVNAMTGTMALVPQVVDAVRIPVIAAGGITDGRGVAAALALGAVASQLGTAFLRSFECGVSQTWKDALGRASEGDTRISRIYSGREVRALDSELRRALEPFADSLPPYPIQQALTAEIRAAAAKAGNADYISAGAGQAVSLAREESAAQILSRLVGEMTAANDSARTRTTTNPS
jgi:nitronate monooxygenase